MRVGGRVVAGWFAGLVAAAFMVIVLSTPSQAGFSVTEIAVDDPPGAPAFRFAPDAIDAAVDEQVHWSRGDEGDARHSITHAKGLFRLAPTSGEIDFTRRFSAGTFRYFCEIHGSPGRGMDGLVRVQPSDASEPDPTPPFTVTWAPQELRDSGDLFDVRFRKQGAPKWKRWKRDTTQPRAVFGANNRPVRVVVGRSYEFQARSQSLNRPRDRSGWSPVLVVEP